MGISEGPLTEKNRMVKISELKIREVYEIYERNQEKRAGINYFFVVGIGISRTRKNGVWGLIINVFDGHIRIGDTLYFSFMNLGLGNSAAIREGKNKYFLFKLDEHLFLDNSFMQQLTQLLDLKYAITKLEQECLEHLTKVFSVKH
jgi:hypothetical protein